MSNGWDYDTFSQYLDTDNEQYDFNEDGAVGLDDYGDYLLDQRAMESNAMSGLNSLSNENFSADQFAQNYEDSGILTPDMTVPGIPGIGSLPGSGYEPIDVVDPPFLDPGVVQELETGIVGTGTGMGQRGRFRRSGRGIRDVNTQAQSGPTGENENYTPEIQTIIDSLGTNNPQTEYTNDGAMGLDDLGDSILNRDTTLQQIIAAIGTENPAYNYAGDEDYIIGMDDVGNFLQGYGLVTVPDPVIQNDGATSGGQTTQGSGGQTSVTGSLYGDVDPADAAAASTFTGDISLDDLNSTAYLYGDAIVPPGYEKIFADIERDPFRSDWAEGRFRPFSYDIDLDDPKFEAYEPAREFLADTWDKAKEAGFDNIESYLLDLDATGNPDYERMRDLYNYHADRYEDLAPAYQRAQQEAFQESLRGQEMTDWLDSPTGQSWTTNALGLFAAQMGIDPADISPEIIELLIDASASGRLADFVSAYGTDGGETYAALFAQEVDELAAAMGIPASEVRSNPTLLEQIGNRVDVLMGPPTGGGGGGDLGGGGGDLGGGDLGGGGGDLGGGDLGGGGMGGSTGQVYGDQTAGSWDFADNNTFAPTANTSPLDNVAGGYYGSSFLDTPDSDIYSDVGPGQGNIMGFWEEGGTASNLSNIEIGEFTQSVIDTSSASSNAYGNNETVGTVEYPAFLVNAANGQNPELMRISGGDPFAWWESLSGYAKSMFKNRYGDELVSMNDATSDVYRRNEAGEITDFLMPEWMAIQLGQAGKELDHKAWSHLSAAERNSLQDKASIDDNLSTELISITSNVNTDNPMVAEYNMSAGQEGIFLEGVNEMPEGGETSRQPEQIETMTYGQFFQTLLANGMDFSGYSGKGKDLPMSDGNKYVVSEMAQLGDADYRGHGYVQLNQGGADWDAEKGSDGEKTEHGRFIAPEIVSYFADHIDDYMIMMGVDPHSAVLSEAAQGAGTDAKFGDAFYFNEDGEKVKIDNKGASILDQMTEGRASAYLNDVEYGDDIENAVAINMGELLQGTYYYDALKGGWKGNQMFGAERDIQDGIWGGMREAGDEYMNPDTYSGINGGHGGGMLTQRNHADNQSGQPYSVGWIMTDHWGEGKYDVLMDQEWGGGYNALNEIAMQVTPLYQAYKNMIAEQNEKPISVTSKEDWWGIYTDAQPDGAYDETPQEKINRMEQQNASAEKDWAAYLAGVDTSNTDDVAYRYGLLGENPNSIGYTETFYGYASGGPVQSHAGNGLGHYFGGGYVDGASGGMDDLIPAVTDGVEPAKLSSGEFVIPADVVSHLGDGNNENGASKLHDMMNRIRVFKTGNPQQPGPVDDSSVMPG